MSFQKDETPGLIAKRVINQAGTLYIWRPAHATERVDRAGVYTQAAGDGAKAF